VISTQAALDELRNLVTDLLSLKPGLTNPAGRSSLRVSALNHSAASLFSTARARAGSVLVESSRCRSHQRKAALRNAG